MYEGEYYADGDDYFPVDDDIDTREYNADGDRYDETPVEGIFPDIPDDEDPAFDENHYRYHTPSGPNPECANCRWLNWQQ